ncbi:hypothetical protein CDD81_4578 [Ophiocordyceps australis]|uniref:Alkyl hydroperoxide reductase subunit C/ Thiol specific antioxidant domain-containing protein n=1 Tax=Ophiocordyceps australis TaxID=1399860 RepID=A0A2C5XTN6_9HYPO|nr:hypothetical protein CDD81_4578 [Ophiocordyceps australis]
MLSSLTTKLALKKVGLSSKDLDFSSQPTKLTSRSSSSTSPDADADADAASPWTANWMSLKALPLTVHPWLSPPAPPVKVAASVPRIGDFAPRDSDGKLDVGRGRPVLVVFLRCVGCAFAQQTFLTLRTLANRHPSLSCIAISHASPAATRKWIDLLGGSWSVSIIHDQDRAIYATWGLGTAGMWYLLHPACQAQGWRQQGWLGDQVAQAVSRRATFTDYAAAEPPASRSSRSSASSSSSAAARKKNALASPPAEDNQDGVSTVLGNKWQEAGAFAIDPRGVVIWGGKATRADDVMDLEEGARLLCM